MNNEEIFKATSIAIKHIGIGVYSSGKIYNYLIQKGISPSVSRFVVEDLVDRQYIDDYKAGRKIINSRTGKKQESKHYIGERLKQGGINRDVVIDLVSSLDSDTDTCLLLFNACYPLLPEEPDLEEMLSLALKRGYSMEVATRTFNIWLQQF